MTKDFIPHSLSAFTGWMGIFAAHLHDLAAKYKVTAGKLTQTQADLTAAFQEKHLTDFAGQVFTQKSVYIQADGELLCIVAPDEADNPPETAAPGLNLRTIPNYALEIEFRKFGMDALRLETRQKGGKWKLAAILTTSPATVKVIPLTGGDGEQIQVRGVFLMKNKIFGSYSPTYHAVIEP